MHTDTNEEKAVIIGAGMVGSTIAYTLMMSGTFSKIALIDIDSERVEGEVMDLSNTIPFLNGAGIYIGNYDDLNDAKVVIVTAGAAQAPSQSRTDLLNINAKILKDIVLKINESGFTGILLIASNPVDILTYVAQEYSKLPIRQVIGTGTVLDTARLKYEIGQKLRVDPRNVHALIVGEHGDNEFALFSCANIAGIPLEDYFDTTCRIIEEKQNLLAKVRAYAYEIIRKKKATYYGIAQAVKRICDAIVHDEHSILPVSARIHARHKHADVVMSLPCVIGKDGIEEYLFYTMNEDEKTSFKYAQSEILSVISGLKL